jgi:hypothetical protein
LDAMMIGCPYVAFGSQIAEGGKPVQGVSAALP